MPNELVVFLIGIAGFITLALVGYVQDRREAARNDHKAEKRTDKYS
jgi:hypothetical protein